MEEYEIEPRSCRGCGCVLGSECEVYCTYCFDRLPRCECGNGTDHPAEKVCGTCRHRVAVRTWLSRAQKNGERTPFRVFVLRTDSEFRCPQPELEIGCNSLGLEFFDPGDGWWHVRLKS